MLIRKTSTPAISNFSSISGELDAGPTVATVFVRELDKSDLFNDGIDLSGEFKISAIFEPKLDKNREISGSSFRVDYRAHLVKP